MRGMAGMGGWRLGRWLQRPRARAHTLQQRFVTPSHTSEEARLQCPQRMFEYVASSPSTSVPAAQHPSSIENEAVGADGHTTPPWDARRPLPAPQLQNQVPSITSVVPAV